MAETSVEIVFDRIAQIDTALAEEVLRATRETAEAVQAAAREAIQTSPASGRSYGSHRASAPGEPPAHMTGRLESAILIRDVFGGQEVYVDEAVAPYGELLEEGSPSGRIAPRPFLSPARDAEEPRFQDRLIGAVRRVTGG